MRCALILLCLLTTARAPAGAIDGHWAGAVVREGAVQQVEFDLATVGHELQGTFSIPELGLYHEPLSEVAFNAPEIQLRFLYGLFRATLHDDIQEIVGLNDKWGPPIRLHLKKQAAPARCRYEEVKFRNGDIVLAGTLVLPIGKGPFPAAVVVCGSGPEGRRDGKSAWMYRGWGETLAQRGMAALVYDKRGVGESQGIPGQWTLADLADDALAGVEILRKRGDIDAKRAGLIGLSQGGWVAPMAVVKDPTIAFLIVQVPPAVSVAEQELDAVAATLSAPEAVEAGVTPSDIAEAQAFQKQMFDVAYGRKTWPQFQPLVDEARAKPWAKFMELPDSEDDLQWWRRNRFDPAQTLSAVRCPVLALFGEHDPLVPPAKNAPLLKKYLDQAGNRDVEIHVLPDVGHNCEMSRRLIGEDWKWPTSFWVWPRKAPGFYPTITAWLQRRHVIP